MTIEKMPQVLNATTKDEYVTEFIGIVYRKINELIEAHNKDEKLFIECFGNKSTHPKEEESELKACPFLQAIKMLQCPFQSKRTCDEEDTNKNRGNCTCR